MTQRQPTVDLPEGKTTRSQVPLECKAAISSTIVYRQPGWKRASGVLLGRETEDIAETNAE